MEKLYITSVSFWHYYADIDSCVSIVEIYIVYKFNVWMYRVLEKYYVGELIDNELPVFPEPG